MHSIKDIAKLAKVSPSTVANVIHGRRDRVSGETFEKVRRILEEQRYVSNMGARLMASRGSCLIALVLAYQNERRTSIVQDPFVSSVIAAVETEVQRKGYFLMLYSNPDMEECRKMALAWNVEGVIVLGCKRQGYYTLREQLDVPIVTIDTCFREEDRDFVNVGLCDYEGGREMTSYLLQRGHRRIGFLSREEGRDHFDPQFIDSARYLGYLAAYKEWGQRPEECWALDLSRNPKRRREQFMKLEQKNFFGCTALFLTSDLLALEFLGFCRDRGISVPDELSIAGFDGIREGERYRPALTTVCQDMREKGTRAVRELLRLLRRERERELPRRDIRLPVCIMERETVEDRGGNPYFGEEPGPSKKSAFA